MKNRSLLMIPGPIEFDPAVLAALGAPTTSHLAPEFMDAFASALKRTRQVFQSEDGQPFVLAGSGTLAMDLAGANLVEPGDRALVVNTGYFGDRFGALLERYGAQVTHLRAAIGDQPTPETLAATIHDAAYRLVVITHVDTSTGVLTDVPALAQAARGSGALVVVDGVCSAAGEDLRMSEWGIDVALTASQKAIGVPPGLALLVASPRALERFRDRRVPVPNYYAAWDNWLPIMDAYENKRAAYFGTPPVNLIFALDVSLGQIMAEGLEPRFARHKALSAACKAGMKALGLGQVPASDKDAAHTMTAPYYPPGVTAADFLAQAAAAGVTLAGGLHPQIRTEYFRIGHMGAHTPGDVLATVGAVESALAACGAKFERGAGVAAAAAVFIP